MLDWQTMTFRAAGIVLIDCEHRTPVATECGFPYVAIPQMKNGRIDFATARRISQYDFESWTKKAKPRPHDVVLSRRTNPGVTATFGTNCEFALGQNLVILRSSGERVLPEFLRWLACSPEWWNQVEKYINVGAIFNSLRCADVPNFELLIPPKDEQRAIGSLLSALDNKIDLNGRMNVTLETMARAIFKDWFVDFGPVRAKAEGRQPPGLAPDIAALFPDALDDDEKPTGWGQATLAAFANVNPEVWSATTHPSEIEYVDLSNVKWGKIEATQQLLWGDAPGRAQRVLRHGDTVVGTVRPGNGSYALISQSNLTGSTGFAVLRAKASVSIPFIYFAATSQSNIERLAHLADGAAYPAVRPEVVLGTEVLRVPDAILGAFSGSVSTLLEQMAHNDAQSGTLAALRDLLLPKLMSGELRIRDAEALVSKAA